MKKIHMILGNARKIILFGVILLVISLSIYMSGVRMFQSHRVKILLIGIDAASWKIIEPLIAGGKLPNIEKLIRNGSYGKLKSIEPMISPALWTTIATGKTFDKHGINSFVEIPPGFVDPIPVTSNLRKSKALWNILTEKNKRSIVVDYYVTYPPEKINGIMISRLDYLPEWASHREKTRVYPSFPCLTYPPSIEGRINKIVSDLKASGIRFDDLTILEAVTKKFITDQWDFFALYTRVIDEGGHLYWKYMEPEKFKDPRWGVTNEKIKELKNHIKDLYLKVDSIIGDLCFKTKGDFITIIVSDHGMKAASVFDPGNVYDSGVHDLNDGVIIISGKGIRKDFRLSNASILDITPTLLYLFNLPVAKDMDGRVLSEVIEPRRFKTNRIKYINTYDLSKGSKTEELPVKSPFDKEIVNRLKSLGYLQ